MKEGEADLALTGTAVLVSQEWPTGIRSEDGSC
jgi:hypothetical protein